MNHSSPEEKKISNHLGRERAESLDRLTEENILLRNNGKELQGQLQQSYKRIAELRTTVDLATEIQKEKQMELDI